MLPAEIDIVNFIAPVYHDFFHVVLLEVNHGGHLVALLGEEVKLVREFLLEKYLTDFPAYPLVDHGFGKAEPIPDFKWAFGVAHGTRTHADSIVVIENISSQMHKSIHRMIQELRPVDLDELGLKDSLQELVDRWQENYPRTHCDLNTKGNFDDVNRMLGVTIYRIVQESLTNTAKYAEADNVSIQLDRYTGQTEGSDYLLLRIKDDGKGINPDESTEGFGIVGMRERVLAARGEFVLNYTPGEGVLIEASLPLSVKDRRKYYRCLKI